MVRDRGSGSFELVGVTSFGFGCGERPGVYAEVKGCSEPDLLYIGGNGTLALPLAQEDWWAPLIAGSNTCKDPDMGSEV